MPICDPRFCETNGPIRNGFARLFALGNRTKTQGLIAQEAEAAKEGTEQSQAERQFCSQEISSPTPETERRRILAELRGAIARIEGAPPARLDAPGLKESRLDAPGLKESRLDALNSKESRLDAPDSNISRVDASRPDILQVDTSHPAYPRQEAPRRSSPGAGKTSDYSPIEDRAARPASGSEGPAETAMQRPCLSLGHPAIDAALGGGLPVTGKPRHGGACRLLPGACRPPRRSRGSSASVDRRTQRSWRSGPALSAGFCLFRPATSCPCPRLGAKAEGCGLGGGGGGRLPGAGAGGPGSQRQSGASVPRWHAAPASSLARGRNAAPSPSPERRAASDGRPFAARHPGGAGARRFRSSHPSPADRRAHLLPGGGEEPRRAAPSPRHRLEPP